MRQTRTHAFAVPEAGLWLHSHEFAALAGLPAWHLALWVQLVARSNFVTGAGRTGYGELINALTPDQPERGPRLWTPSRDDVKAAVRRLEALQLLGVDRRRSEQLQCLVFLIAPRSSRGVPRGKLPRELPPTSLEGERPKLPPRTPPGLSAGNTYPLPPVDNELSPGARARNRLREHVAEARAAGGGKRAPKGA